MGSAAARALGPNRGTRPRLHLAVQYSFRNRGRRLHHVGSSSQPGGTGIRGNGGRSRRVAPESIFANVGLVCEDSRPSPSLYRTLIGSTTHIAGQTQLIQSEENFTLT